MKGEPLDKYFGVSLSEWVERIPNELEVDAVGLWQIIVAGKDSFELSGSDLRDFVRRAIIVLLDSKAVPVLSSSEPGVFWVRQSFYGDNPDEVAEGIISEWERSGHDPDHDGLWFAVVES